MLVPVQPVAPTMNTKGSWLVMVEMSVHVRECVGRIGVACRRQMQ